CAVWDDTLSGYIF
nr:immunoglobulin light chain junction region [Macaca mulatta]